MRSYMNDSKWDRLFDFLSDTFFIKSGQVKLLSKNQYYPIALEIMDENRQYSEDYIAGPIKLSEIEYLMIPFTKNCEENYFFERLNSIGQFEYEVKNTNIYIYGYRFVKNNS